jgi:hypothetical protein
MSLLMFVDSVAKAEGEKKPVSVGTTTVLAKMHNGAEVRATLKVEKAVASKLSHRDYWGTMEGIWGPDTTFHEGPRSIVTRLTVAIGRDTVFIPFSAYGDLSEPNEVSVSSGGAGVTVYVRGGDAAASYFASLVVLHGLLYKRRVESGEFSSERWEETVYSWIPDADDR